MPVKLSEVYRLAHPFIVLVDKSQGIGQLVTELAANPRTHEMRKEIVRKIRGDKSQTNKSFADEVSAALQFPQDFTGRSWDAFNEFVNDLDWLPATKNYVLLITNADQLLSEEPYKDIEILMHTFETTAKNWESGTNHDNLVRAYQAEVVPKTSMFTVLFQVSPGSNQTSNFMRWLEGRPDITRVKF